MKKQQTQKLRNTFIVRSFGYFLVGGLILVFAELTLYQMFLLFSVSLTVDAVGNIAAAGVLRDAKQRWHVFAYAAIPSLLAAFLLMLLPYLPELGLTAWHIMIGWSFVGGLFLIDSAFSIRRMIKDEVVMLLGGIIQVAFGVWMLFFYESTEYSDGFVLPMITVAISLAVIFLLLGIEHHKALPQLD